ncbi:MAG TPA: class I SAM-dependent methyltransferase [Acidimicrobiales bacterium]|nr:class I SAM-dependent methyltransferase [Acidimicrobiales bacterium]
MPGNTEHHSHEDVLAQLVDVAGKRVVDVGCRSGGLVRWLRGQGADVVGVECGEVMLGMARASDPDHLEAYLEGVGQALPLGDAEFDVVVYSYSLHHVPATHMVDALREASRVLCPRGTLYVVEPIAAGPGHEVVRLIDDETEARALAQAALEHAADVGLELVTEHRYNSRMVLAGADALIERVVGVDPRRARRMDQHRAQFVELFETLATPVDGGYALEQENRVKIFRKS